jgi:hypothetical protein
MSQDIVSMYRDGGREIMQTVDKTETACEKLI